MPQFEVLLARLVREEASVIVQANSREQVQAALGQIYRAVDHGWQPDNDWCEQGQHQVLDRTDEPADFQITKEGVMPVRRQ